MTLAECAAYFCAEVERELARRGLAPGGQHVRPTGDFISAPPSVLNNLAFWARQMRAALDAEVRP